MGSVCPYAHKHIEKIGTAKGLARLCGTLSVASAGAHPPHEDKAVKEESTHDAPGDRLDRPRVVGEIGRRLRRYLAIREFLTRPAKCSILQPMQS